MYRADALSALGVDDRTPDLVDVFAQNGRRATTRPKRNGHFDWPLPHGAGDDRLNETIQVLVTEAVPNYPLPKDTGERMP